MMLPAPGFSTIGAVRRIVDMGRAWAERGRDLLARIPGFDAGVETLEAEARSGAPLLAGGLAYRLFFWLVAFGLFNAAILSFWVRDSPEDVKATARSFGLAGVATNSATSAIRDGSHARWYFLIAGLILLVYFGMGAARALYVSSVLAWRLDPVRLQRPIRASAIFTGAVIGAFALSLGSEWLRHHAPKGGLLGAVAASLALVVASAAVFWILPHGPVRSWRSLLPGAIEVAVGMTAIQLVVVYYLANKLERSPKLYGALGASTVVLLWLFLVARLVIAGMFLNATLERRRTREPEEPVRDPIELVRDAS
jgi:uncharacterized BrkB/YihY/UPF0761 family membrane protein